MKYICMCAQLRPTPCNPMECSLPVFSVHGVFQADSLPVEPPRKPKIYLVVLSLSCHKRDLVP